MDLAARLGPLLNTNVIIDNRGGASSIIGTMEVVRARADGHTVRYTDDPYGIDPKHAALLAKR